MRGIMKDRLVRALEGGCRSEWLASAQISAVPRVRAAGYLKAQTVTFSERISGRPQVDSYVKTAVALSGEAARPQARESVAHID